ncbi:Pre-mRNA-splicing factor ISY1 [Gossypium arboreum]|uniref:Pre-mRNA-splicing factor ISY1 n=2 Tax=Gossypium arboreum TaxID=29729 RepID=A0A0B0N3G5_GOSAR|nr:Pre-mRNA-splicing factor ISY1 [Gossypium arboreum]
MARNEEKAQSMLNRFIALKAEEKKKPKERRPFLASECRDLAEADKWRQQIMREIGHKVAEIQNDGLGEHRLRDLNDEINKLIREKSHWERRMVELGGPNYAKQAPKMTDLEGNIVDVPNPSGRGPGYRYFGAAKKLPGVRELFERQPELRKRRRRDDINKNIDASYYGYRDEGLARVEGPTEAKMRTEAEEEWRRVEEIRREARRGAKEVVTVGAAAREVLFEEEEDVVEEERREREEKERKDKEREFVVHEPLPDDKEIERMIVERKKMELLSKYASEGLLEEQSEAMDMLNIYRCLYVEYKNSGIDVQCQVALYVATKTASIKRPSFFVPSTNGYAHAAMRWIGYETRCTTYWPHSILWGLAYSLPGSVVDAWRLCFCLGVQKRGNSKILRRRNENRLLSLLYVVFKELNILGVL